MDLRDARASKNVLNLTKQSLQNPLYQACATLSGCVSVFKGGHQPADRKCTKSKFSSHIIRIYEDAILVMGWIFQFFARDKIWKMYKFDSKMYAFLI